MQDEYLRLAAKLWAGTRAADGHADEGPRHLRPAGVRLMHDRSPTSARRGAAADLFRPHRGRGLVAADLGRAGRPHPRHRARRPRPDARARCSSWLPADLRGRARARCRLRHRRARGRGRAARRRGRRHRPLAHAGRPRPRAHRRSDLGAGQIEFRVGDMLDPALGRFDHVVAMDSLIHYRAGDVVRARGRPRRPAPSAPCSSPSRRAPPLLAVDARGRPAVPAQRPRAGDRAGGRATRCVGG